MRELKWSMLNVRKDYWKVGYQMLRFMQRVKSYFCSVEKIVMGIGCDRDTYIESSKWLRSM